MDDFGPRFQPELAEIIREHANRAGGFPALLGLTVESFGPGTVRCRLAVRAELDNSVGTIHGGALAALVDHTISLAVYPLVEPGVWVATAGMSLQYLKPVKAGECVATGTVLSLTGRSGAVRVDVENEGRLVVSALGTVSVKDKRSP
jgi:uncharacterized protein (TIGR00369 family)